MRAFRRRVANPPTCPPAHPSVVTTEFLFFSDSFSLPRSLSLSHSDSLALSPLGSACKRQSDRRADGSCIIIKFRVRTRPRAPHPRGDETTRTHAHTCVLEDMYIILFCCAYSSNINTILLLLLPS